MVTDEASNKIGTYSQNAMLIINIVQFYKHFTADRKAHVIPVFRINQILMKLQKQQIYLLAMF